MTRKGWSRSFIIKEVKRLRMILCWAVGWEMIPQTLVDSLMAVKALAAGDSDAPKSRQRQAIPEPDLQAVRKVLSTRNRDVFEGLNSKIMSLKRRAGGYRNPDSFKTAIDFHCGGSDLYPR